MKKAMALFLAIVCALSLPATALAAGKEVLLVNFGDSIAVGQIENRGLYPGYNEQYESYSGLLAGYFGTERVNYARRGMQTTDILYIFDEDYREVIDNSKVKPDSWHQDEYPPFDGIPCEKVIEDVKNADYITICAGVCDYISYPNDLKAIDEEKLPDKDEITERLKGYLSDGILDGETFKALKELMSAESDSAKVTASYIMNILEGYTDFSVCYPQIIKTMRELNPDCTIIVIGTFLPDKLTETEDSSVFIYLLNRILDRLNAVMRATAITYGCVYVDTMGIESNWHPTVNGYKQIYNRIISVLNGEIKYSGGISLASKLVGNITGKLMSSPIKLRLGTLCGKLVKINNLIGSIREKLLKI